MSPVGAIFVPFPPKTGTNMLHPRPLQSLNWSLTPLGSCTSHEVLALVRPVVPYALALSSKRARPVVSLTPWPIGGQTQAP